MGAIDKKEYRTSFSNAEINRIIDALNRTDKGGDSNCSNCGHSIMQLYPTAIAFSAPILNDDGSYQANLKSEESLSAVALCTNCGYTRIFNLEILGVQLDKQSKPDE